MPRHKRANDSSLNLRRRLSPSRDILKFPIRVGPPFGVEAPTRHDSSNARSSLDPRELFYLVSSAVARHSPAASEARWVSSLGEWGARGVSGARARARAPARRVARRRARRARNWEKRRWEETREASRGRARRALVVRTRGRPRNAGRSSTRKGTGVPGAPAGAWVRPRKRPSTTCRCVFPPRLLRTRTRGESFSLILFDDDGARPRPRPSRADFARSPRTPPRRAAPQDHLLEVVFGHLAADSKPREYFDATLTCVPSLAFANLLGSRDPRNASCCSEKQTERARITFHAANRANARRGGKRRKRSVGHVSKTVPTFPIARAD